MPVEVLKFKRTGNGRFSVEIWGDFREECGDMNVDDMLPFLEHLKIIAATPQEVIQWLREAKDGLDVVIEKRKHEGVKR